jgi:hypothetical protein
VSESFTDDVAPGEAPDATAATAAVRAVRRAEEQLAATEGTPAAAHLSTYDEVHAVLQDALADLDEH